MNDFFSSTNNKKINPVNLEPLLLFSVLFLPGFLSQGVQETDPAMFNSFFFNFLYIITVVPQLLLVLYIIVLKPGRSLADFNIGRIRTLDIPLSLLTLAGIYIVIIPVGFVSMMIEPEIENQFVYGPGWQFTDYKLLPLVFLTCLATGYTEEIFFRAYLFKSLRKAGAATVPAVLVTSILFGAGHVYEGYYAFAATTAIGVFLSLIFLKTKSIHAVSIGHGLYNFSVLLIAMTEVI